MQTSKPHMFGFMSPEKNMIILKTYALHERNKHSTIIINSELLVFELYNDIVLLFKIH